MNQSHFEMFEFVRLYNYKKLIADFFKDKELFQEEEKWYKETSTGKGQKK